MFKIPSQIFTLTPQQPAVSHDPFGWIYFEVDATEGGFTIDLPDARSVQALLCFNRIDFATGNDVTIQTVVPGQWIKNAAPGEEGTSIALKAFSNGPNHSFQFISNLENWRII